MTPNRNALRLLTPGVGQPAANDASAVLAPSPPIERTEHTSGLPHVRATLAKMGKLATEGSHSYPIRNLATRITHGVPHRRPELEIAVLYRWVRDNIRYRKDPFGLEWVQSPERTVKERAGDCDDLTTLIAALAGSLGHAFKFRTVGATPEWQQHVAAEIWDGTHWVSLDPVIEPKGTSTAPRADNGVLGHRAVGASHLWSENGQMINGVANRKQREMWRAQLFGLGGVPSKNDLTLWQWNAYYPPTPPRGGTPGAGNRGGEPERPVLRYGSSDRPGYLNGKPILLILAGKANRQAASMIDGLGQVPYTHPTLGFGLLKAIGKVAGGITKIPGLNIAAGLIPGGSTILSAAKMAGKIAGGGGKGHPSAPGAAPSGGGGGGSGDVALPTGVPIITNLATRSDIADLRTDIQNLARLATREDVERLARMLTGKEVPSSNGAPTASSPAARAHHGAHATQAAKAKYPATARQKQDPRTGAFHVYVPHPATLAKRGRLHGLGAVRPTLMFSLGAADANTAAAAVDAVAAFIKGNKQPPQVPLGAVRAFQKADGKLSADGLWGPNARVAAAYYLAQPVDDLPPVAKPYQRYKITWEPPVTPAAAPPVPGAPMLPAAAPTPAPAPSGYAPTATLVPMGPPAPVASQAPAPVRHKAITPAPRASSLPVPGFQEVGIEKTSPGLPPVDAITAAASPAVAARRTPPGKKPQPKRAAAVVPMRVKTASGATAIVPVALPPPPIAPGQTIADFDRQAIAENAEVAEQSSSDRALMWIVLYALWRRSRRPVSSAA